MAHGKIYDVVLRKKYGEDGLCKEETNSMFDMLKSEKGYPVEFMAKESEYSAIGFISPEAASTLEFDYKELKDFVAKILDGEVESNGCSYQFNGLLVWLNG